MGKEVKTNAVRILERNKVPYELLTYECDEFIDGIHSAEATGTPSLMVLDKYFSLSESAGAGQKQKILRICHSDCRRG